MITFEEALSLTLSYKITSAFETGDLSSSLNRVLAQDVISDINMPPFDKSAMDGYAFRKEDIDKFCEVIEIIPAGKKPVKPLSKGKCSKIMTGACIPEGTEIVIPVEDTETDSNGNVKCINEHIKSNNICRVGEDIKKGQLLLKKGTLLKPSHIPVLATAGCVKPLLFKKACVSVISTGDELVEPHQFPGAAQIRNSNASQILAQAETSGAAITYLGIISDNENETYKIINNALTYSDIIILSGGVSMGDFDFIPKVLKETGADIIYKSIAVQPGRPTVFAKKDNKFIFGLPGNPVSSYVVFEILVKPLLYKITGAEYTPLSLQLRMGNDYKRRNTERLAIIPVKISSDNQVFPVEYHGSAHINAYAEANGMAFIPIGTETVKKGELVNVRPL